MDRWIDGYMMDGWPDRWFLYNSRASTGHVVGACVCCFGENGVIALVGTCDVLVKLTDVL